MAAPLAPSPFTVNPTNRGSVISQLSARPVGEMPPFLLQRDHPLLDTLLAQTITPLEQSAVLYRISDAVNGVFLQRLRQEKGLKQDEMRKVFEIKDKLLRLLQQYAGTDKQLNIFKILSLRLTARIGRLIKKIPDNFKVSLSPSLHTALINMGKKAENFSDILAISALAFKSFLKKLEFKILDKQDVLSWPTLQEQEGAELLETLLAQLPEFFADQEIRSIVQEIQEDRALLQGLLLAPQTLFPLAVRSLRTSDGLTPAVEELRKILEDHCSMLEKCFEQICIKHYQQIEKKGAKAKKCQLALKTFYQNFKVNYQPLLARAFRFLHKMEQEVYSKSTGSAESHFLYCQQLLITYKKESSSQMANQLQAHYAHLLNIVTHAPALPLFQDASSIVINQWLLPFQATFQRLYDHSLTRSLYHLKEFCRTYERYIQLIPLKEREMQTDIYTPLDLLLIHFLESVRSIIDQVEEVSINCSLQELGLLTFEIHTLAAHWYELSFPYFKNEEQQLNDLFHQALEILKDVEAELEAQATLYAQTAPFFKKIQDLLHCLKSFLLSPPAYPFLFNPLGLALMEDKSHEHELTVRLARQVCQTLKFASEEAYTIHLPPDEEGLQPWLEQGYTREAIELMLPPPDEEEKESPVMVTLSDEGAQALFSPSHLCIQQTMRQLRRNRESLELLPPLTSSNLLTVFPSLSRFLSPVLIAKRDLSILKLEESQPSDEAKIIEKHLTSFEVDFLFSYRLISRYVTLRTQGSDTPPPSKPPPASTRSKRAFPVLPSEKKPPSRNIRSEKPPTSLMQSIGTTLHHIQHSLALPTDRLKAESLISMRDYHYQISSHLGSLEDLLAYDLTELSIYQLKSLLVHQASAIEQTVKLAALARAPTGKQEQELKELLKTSHFPSDFFPSLLLPRRGAQQKMWQKTVFTASAVDGFLTVPARYTLGTHPWLTLLNNEERDLKEIHTLIQNNLMALQVLLQDVTYSLPQPTLSLVTASIQLGTIEGLSQQGLLQCSPQQADIVSSFPDLHDLLDKFSSLNRVSRISPYETASDLARRREEIHSNLQIIRANQEEVDELLQETHPVSWCGTYSSTLLLRAAVILEKSLQSLLFWLPVAGQEEDRHYLFSTRPGAGNRSVPLRHTHSIIDNGAVIAKKFNEQRQTRFAERLKAMSDQLGWLEPFIRQLYRYPFSSTEHRAAEIPRLFQALATLRRDLHADNLSASEKRALEEALGTTSAALVTTYDQLIETHLQTRVIAPVYEILTASQEILEMWGELTHS